MNVFEMVWACTKAIVSRPTIITFQSENLALNEDRSSGVPRAYPK